MCRSRVIEITESSSIVTVSTGTTTLGEFRVHTGDVLCLDPTAADHKMLTESTDSLNVHCTQ